jgi:hypothetical protein
MNPWYAVTAGLFVAWLGGMAYYLLRAERAAEGRHRGPSPERAPKTVLPPGHVIVDPPLIDGVTLHHWLVQRHPREHREGRNSIWGEVTTQFFKLELADDEIAARFAGVADMDKFQGHFLSALCILTNTGLTVGVLNAMRKKHAGLGITSPEYDRTIINMVKVLDSKGVPDAAVQQLGRAVEELRGAIVATPAGRAT